MLGLTPPIKYAASSLQFMWELYANLTPRAAHLFAQMSEPALWLTRASAIARDQFEKMRLFFPYVVFRFLDYPDAISFARTNRMHYSCSGEIARISSKSRIDLNSLVDRWLIHIEHSSRRPIGSLHRLDPLLRRDEKTFQVPTIKTLSTSQMAVQDLDTGCTLKGMTFPRHCRDLRLDVLRYVQRPNNPTYLPEAGIWELADVMRGVAAALAIARQHGCDPLLLLPRADADPPNEISQVDATKIEPELQQPTPTQYTAPSPSSSSDEKTEWCQNLGTLMTQGEILDSQTSIYQPKAPSRSPMFILPALPELPALPLPAPFPTLSNILNTSPSHAICLPTQCGNFCVITRRLRGPLFALKFESFIHWNEEDIVENSLLLAWVSSINHNVRSLWLDGINPWLLDIPWPALETIYFAENSRDNRAQKMNPFNPQLLPKLNCVYFPSRMTGRKERNELKSLMPTLKLVSRATPIVGNDWIQLCLQGEENPMAKYTRKKKTEKKEREKTKRLKTEKKARLGTNKGRVQKTNGGTKRATETKNNVETQKTVKPIKRKRQRDVRTQTRVKKHLSEKRYIQSTLE